MIEILKTVTPSPEQMVMVIEGMRNPMNSWNKSDSYCTYCENEQLEMFPIEYFVGEKDLDLMMRLANGGPVHAKYRRMMPVFVTINAPLYWWKEFDTYKVGTVCNSCSTMHKIHEKEFKLEDFSYEHLIHFPFDGSPVDLSDQEVKDQYNSLHITGTDVVFSPEGVFEVIVNMLNRSRHLYLKTGDKTYWWQMIQLLPSSYNQRRTVMLNYEVLHNIYISRKEHKLDEWVEFCKWIDRTLG